MQTERKAESKMYKSRRNVIKEMVKGIIETITCVAIFGMVLIFMLHIGTRKDEYYYTDNGNGTGYVQLVDKPCIVTEINDGIVTVETCNGGELYTFYGTGYKIGTKIICTFTMTDELIKAK